MLKIEKGDEVLIIHESTLTEHESLGWKLAGEVEENQDDSDNSKLKVEEIKARLTELGVEFDQSLKKPELLALLNETLATNQEKGDSE
ncbi:HeH/LEM domain-containing protein [Pasteurella sp. PK-2025]|uniref:HeH/LEM domain-containing protein n=1 Tax=Pasteurella sp. PK-2025 TaxID=3413133 RepID=UPI003C73C332